MTMILETSRLCRSFPGFDLKDVNLKVAPGTILGLIGPNGAGKTTFMKLVMGQIQPNSGLVNISGLAYPHDLKEIRRRIGFVGEDPPFKPEKSVQEIADFMQPYYPGWDSALLNALMRDFEIEHNQRIESLSHGRKTLLSLALALSHGAELLLLDEPTAGLDAIKRRQVLRLMAEFVVDGNRSVVITTHQTDGLAPLVNQIAILHNGRLILESETEELLASWKWVLYRDGSLNQEIEKNLVCRENGAFGNRGIIQNFSEHAKDLESGQAAGDIQIANTSIDDILVSLTEGK
jgi:ABC-2 type transport system ATP-binding protein